MNKQLQFEKVKTEIHADKCYHCGDPCENSRVVSGDKVFCCNGCKLVFEILESNDMCTYYDLESSPGTTPNEYNAAFRFSYLNDENTARQLLDFSDGERSRVTFRVPAMHCSSCIWLLENLYKLNPAIYDSRVNFLKKEITVSFRQKEISLREIVEILASLGYEPEIKLADLEEKARSSGDRNLYIKLGIAGFAFANIMLFSFPEYLAFGKDIGPEFRRFFGYLSILVALPVLFYSSIDYFKSALNSFRQRLVNMDVPISLGIIALFGRSMAEIIVHNQSGYLDSFASLVFLLLVGKLFQKKTYDALSFDRDYKSFFPVSVVKINEGNETTVPVSQLQIGDRILLKNNEIIPADAVLIRGDARIDYSFVTGESMPVNKVSGDMLYAGGKQCGGAVEVEIIKNVSQSYLTQLWNNDSFQEDESVKVISLANRVSKYFTIAVLTIATAGAIYWWGSDPWQAMNAFTAVLIIACPCALALSTPFTLGNSLRILGKFKFYLKNIHTIELLSKIDVIVFDKTGTITVGSETVVELSASAEPDERQQSLIKSLVRHSSHPLSQKIYAYFAQADVLRVDDFEEIAGQGIRGFINGTEVKIGSARFLGITENAQNRTSVYFQIGNENTGHFHFNNKYRPGLSAVVSELADQRGIYLLSGDNDSEKANLVNIFSNEKNLYFNQSPMDKLNFIGRIQKSGKKVLMVGDGLNDAGALKQSDVGISVAENTNVFSPACDGILESDNFEKLPGFMKFARFNIRVIAASFMISFLYNIIGLSFAVQGTLSPLIAAILMPVSSVSVIVFATGMTSLFAGKYLKGAK